MAAGELFDIYLDWVDETESPLIFHRWSLVSAISTALGRNLVFGENTPLQTYANQYVVLVGPPASRKNTALKFPKTLLQSAGFKNFASDRSSKEKFILDLAQGFSEVADNVLDLKLDATMEALIHAPELQDFLGMGNMDFISFLTNMWDMPTEYSHRLKNSQSTKLINPTINLVGGATATTLAEIFPDKVAGQGFLSRALLIFGKGARKKITFPSPPNFETQGMLTEVLAAIHKSAVGHAILTDDARTCLDEIYKNWAPIPDSRLETYSGRRFTSLIKNCMVVAASDLSFCKEGVLIDVEHVIYANSMLSFAEGFMPRALGNLGNSRNLEIQNKVIGVLEANPDGLTISELYNNLTSVVDSLHQLGEIIKHMLTLGRVAVNSGTKKFFGLMAGPKKGVHCDFTLLKEGLEYYKELEDPKHEKEEQSDADLFGIDLEKAGASL